MKHTTTIALAVLVMAVTGCETDQHKEARGLVRTFDGDWVKKGTPYFGDGKPIVAPGSGGGGGGGVIAFDPTVFDNAMAAQQQAPAPLIVAGQEDGTTIATQSSSGTVVWKFGGQRPNIPPIPYPYPYFDY